jgi:hypothetical protein
MKSTPQKVLLTALLKKVAFVSNRWIGARAIWAGPAA